MYKNGHKDKKQYKIFLEYYVGDFRKEDWLPSQSKMKVGTVCKVRQSIYNEDYIKWPITFNDYSETYSGLIAGAFIVIWGILTRVKNKGQR